MSKQKTMTFNQKEYRIIIIALANLQGDIRYRKETLSLLTKRNLTEEDLRHVILKFGAPEWFAYNEKRPSDKK